MSRLSDSELRILEKSEINCRDVTALLGDFVENEISTSLRDRVHQHIRSCTECQEGERRYREVIQLAKELPQPEFTEDIKKRLREALNRRLGLNLPIE
jgi:hypothetical protein